MSVSQNPDPFEGPNLLQIWDNAAFDDDRWTDGSKRSTPCWCPPLQPISLNRSAETLAHDDSSKENRSPGFPKSPVSKKSQGPIKPFRTNKPFKVVLFREENKSGEGGGDYGSLDMEIEEIEKEIGRLSSKLEALRLKKVEGELKAAASGRRGRIIPAKFLESSQSSIKNAEVSALKKIDESPASTRSRRRGVSLGPSEITPAQSLQSRRKSCFWKLQDISEEEHEENNGRGRRSSSLSPKSKPFLLARASEAKQRILSISSRKIAESVVEPKLGKKLQETKEEKVVKNERGRSLSPKSRPSIAKITDTRKGVTTVGSKKTSKRENLKPTSLQPKILFQDSRNPLPGKKLLKNSKARTVASRYSLVTGDAPESKRRKWSLPENDKEEFGRARTSRMSLPRIGQNLLSSDRQFQIPGNCRVDADLFANSPPSITKIVQLLPKIRTSRCINDSPRDSGAAKRVIDLIGKRSHFGTAVQSEEARSTSHQSFNFEENE